MLFWVIKESLDMIMNRKRIPKNNKYEFYRDFGILIKIGMTVRYRCSDEMDYFILIIGVDNLTMFLVPINLFRHSPIKILDSWRKKLILLYADLRLYLDKYSQIHIRPK
jgi:hypothetical protein